MLTKVAFSKLFLPLSSFSPGGIFDSQDSVHFCSRFALGSMDQHAGAQTGAPPDSDPDPDDKKTPDLVIISPTGDVILDVTFDTSRETLKSSRKSTRSRPGQAARPALKAKVRLGFRVQLSVLKKQSKYFENLLSDSRFQEARSIADAFAKLSLWNVKPEDAGVKDLPWVKIVDDDEATRSVSREVAFGDLMRILHGKDATFKPPTISYVVILAVLADRFDCTAPVSRYLNTGLKFKWPATLPRASKEEAEGLSRASEELIRQKILVAWLLDQPTKMYVATRELIMYGSSRWCAYPEPELNGATWWDLPDDLEGEQHAGLDQRVFVAANRRQKESSSTGASAY